jgi:hypothetical protein
VRLYLTAKGRYVGTQDDAKRDGKGWSLAEVPTDKAGLIEYLNDQLPSTPLEPEIERDEPQERTDFMPPPPVLAKPAPQTQWTTDEILDFILDHASINQVANILSCIGTRFAEMIKTQKGE